VAQSNLSNPPNKMNRWTVGRRHGAYEVCCLLCNASHSVACQHAWQTCAHCTTATSGQAYLSGSVIKQLAGRSAVTCCFCVCSSGAWCQRLAGQLRAKGPQNADGTASFPGR